MINETVTTDSEEIQRRVGNVNKAMTVEGFRCGDIRQCLFSALKVVTTGYFPLRIFSQKDRENGGTLKLSGSADKFDKLEKLFSSMTFRENHEIRVDTQNITIPDAKAFLTNLAIYLSGSSAPLSFPISREMDVLRLGCDDNLLLKLEAFIIGTKFELIKKNKTENSKDKIIVEA